MSTSADEESDLVAAELAFGLLDAPDRQAAEARLGHDPVFAEAHARWASVAAALLVDASDLPRPSLWHAIVAALPGTTTSTSPARRWQWATAVSAMAAAILLVIAVRHPTTRTIIRSQPTRSVSPPLLAVLTGPQTSAAVAISLDRGAGRLTLSPVRLSLGRRVPELWVIPAGGKPHALGVVSASLAGSVAAPAEAARLFAPGATLAISEEPVGGSPTGQPTGKVILTGTLVAG